MAPTVEGSADAKTVPTPSPAPVEPPTPTRASRRKSPPTKLTLDDPEMPPLREVIPKNQALVSPPIVKTTPKGNYELKNLEHCFMYPTAIINVKL